MIYFKDTKDAVYGLESADFGHLLPDGCVEITEQEAEDLRPRASAKDIAAAEIRRLEAESMIPRVTREFMIDLAEQSAQSKGITLEQLAAANAGYRKLKVLDDQIKALRAQL